MTIFKKITQSNNIFYKLLLNIFYTLRFFYYALINSSICCLRYYPGYHGSNIPNMKYLRNGRNKIFHTENMLTDGIDLNTEQQLALLNDLKQYYSHYKPSENRNDDNLYHYKNDMFGYNDGFFLFAFINHFKPSKIVEIGSGFSSALMIDTCTFLSLNTQLTFIDPYSKNIKNVVERAKNQNFRLIRTEVQEMNIEVFEDLKNNDILFIDSSHVVKIGSDLSYIFFKIIPCLADGVIIHIHDIWYPWEYPESMIFKGRLYNEAYFIRSFLQFNTSFEIMFFSSHLEKMHKNEFLSMPNYFRNTGKSLWIRKISS